MQFDKHQADLCLKVIKSWKYVKFQRSSIKTQVNYSLSFLPTVTLKFVKVYKARLISGSPQTLEIFTTKLGLCLEVITSHKCELPNP